MAVQNQVEDAVHYVQVESIRAGSIEPSGKGSKDRATGSVPSNRWNRMVYRAWAPICDRALQRFFTRERTTAVRTLVSTPVEF